MRILTRYILRAHVGPALFALSALTSILLINGVARQLESLAGKGLPASVFVNVVLYSLPFTLAETIPMSVLVAVLYTFTQLSADNEISALKASGVNLQRLLWPVLVVGVLVAGFMVVFYDRVLPEANHRLMNLRSDIARKLPTLKLEEQVLNPVQSSSGMYYLQAASIDAATNRLRDVVIYDLSHPGLNRAVYADSGRMAFNRDRTDLFLDLNSGWINEADVSTPTRFRRTFFGRELLRVPGVGNQLERSENATRSEREMSIAMLHGQVVHARRNLTRVQGDLNRYQKSAVDSTLAGRGILRLPASVPMPTGPYAPGLSSVRAPDLIVLRAAAQLRGLRNQLAAEQHVLDTFLVEYYKKFALPFASIVFVLIGGPLALRFPRGGTGAVIAISLAIFSIYYVSLMGGETLSEKGYLSPFLAMWGANIVFLGLSAVGVARMGRERSSANRGSWQDLFDNLRAAIGRPGHR